VQAAPLLSEPFSDAPFDRLILVFPLCSVPAALLVALPFRTGSLPIELGPRNYPPTSPLQWRARSLFFFAAPFALDSPAELFSS